MLVKVLNALPYAADGVNVRILSAGATEDIRDEFVDGLAAEGFISKPASAVKAKAIPPSPSPPAPIRRG